jgi:hypothetical protein
VILPRDDDAAAVVIAQASVVTFSRACDMAGAIPH